jgi:hypothetical protein
VNQPVETGKGEEQVILKKAISKAEQTKQLNLERPAKQELEFGSNHSHRIYQTTLGGRS